MKTLGGSMERDFSFDPGSDVMRSRAKEIGNKMKICFWIELFNIIGPLILAVMAISAIGSVMGGGNVTTAKVGVLSLATIIGIVAIVLAVIYAIVILSLKKYDDGFLYAGLLYIGTQVIPLIQNNTSGFVAVILGLLNLAVSLGFVKYFIDSLVTSTRLVNGVVASSLEAYLNWYIIFVIASIVCAFAAYIPIINLIAALASIVIAIGSIVIGIWRLRLIWQAASVLQRHGNY